MERSSYFIEKKALFGSFPTQEAVTKLEEIGVRYFIDLTHSTEKKIVPYTTQFTYISYPIVDRQIPLNKQKFATFIIKLSDIINSLNENQKIYIHCKGGHGRSGVVVSVLLCFMLNIIPDKALNITSICHSKRRVMREKWRKIGSPQTQNQKNFVYHFCRKLTFFRAYKSGPTFGFSNFSKHTVTVKDIGTFPTLEAAFQAHKNLKNIEYVDQQLTAKSPMQSKILGNKIAINSYWKKNRINIMYKLLTLKFNQHLELKRKLLSTGLCPIILNNHSDNFWGIGKDKKGLNMLGKLITKMRSKFYKDKVKGRPAP